MSKFIVLHEQNGGEVFINVDHIRLYMASSSPYYATNVVTTMGTIEVKETTQDISYMIGNIVTKK